jgi:hypothetical protein
MKPQNLQTPIYNYVCFQESFWFPSRQMLEWFLKLHHEWLLLHRPFIRKFQNVVKLYKSQVNFSNGT